MCHPRLTTKKHRTSRCCFKVISELAADPHLNPMSVPVCPVFRPFLPTNRSSSIAITAAVPFPRSERHPFAVPMASVLADGRQLCVFADDAQMAQQLVTEVTSAAKENIAKKGSAWTGRRWNMAGDTVGRLWELGIVWEYGNSMGRIYGRIWEYKIGHIHMISMNQLSSGGGNGSEGYPSSPNALGEPVGAMN